MPRDDTPKQIAEWLQGKLNAHSKQLEEEQQQAAKLQKQIAQRQTIISHLQGVLSLTTLEQEAEQEQFSRPAISDLREETLHQPTVTSTEVSTKTFTTESLPPQKLLQEAYRVPQEYKVPKISSTNPRGESKRLPMEMLRPQYQDSNKKLGDIVELVLKEYERPISTKELTSILYDTKSEDEFQRARNSLSSELRAQSDARSDGKPPRWKKLGRNTYTCLTNTEIEQEADSQTEVGSIGITNNFVPAFSTHI